MLELWFVTIDTARLRRQLYGAAKSYVSEALRAAADATGTGLRDHCVLPFGIRAIVAAKGKTELRALFRRTLAFARCRNGASVRWRRTATAVRVPPASLPSFRAFIARSRALEMTDSAPSTIKPKRGNARSAAVALHIIEQTNDAMLGGDECAAKLRRYVASCDAPPDDSTAFERLCSVVFAQGLSNRAVEARSDDLRRAFADFRPDAVAAFGAAELDALCHAPIICNRAKIEACVENARRWQRAASEEGSYLARVAKTAAADDAATGWPALAALLCRDFVRLGESAASQTLKRWGFFTARVHPVAGRILARLGFVDEKTPPHAVQRFLWSVAQRAGRDAYVVEGALVLFGTAGPCRMRPLCKTCGLADRCPSAELGDNAPQRKSSHCLVRPSAADSSNDEPGLASFASA